MMFKKLALIVFFLLIRYVALADVFVVTSNADSGPGTLREALTLAAANGNAVKDYINFSLPALSISSRTIIVTTQLPDVSSNLVIDGSTQPGQKFGVSSAKVCIQYEVLRQQSKIVLRITNQHDVEIYGLFIKNVPNVNEWPGNQSWQGIDIKSGKNIQIGAAGKGNVINGFMMALAVNFMNQSEYYLENLTVKDNFLNVDTDGRTQPVNETQKNWLMFLVGKIDIGGTANERNVIADGLLIYQINYGSSTQSANHYTNLQATINVQNNNIGVDYSGQIGFPKSWGLDISTSNPSGRNIVNISDNIIKTTGAAANAINIGNAGRKVTILRNYIGTNRTRDKSFKTGGIFIYYANEVRIGSNDVADANYITNCKPVSVWPFSYVAVNKNSFYCADNSPMHFGGYGAVPPPVINIVNTTANSIKGTATPNAIVELFYVDHCGTCSPETYFATTTADANGNWQYIGSISNTVLASATFDKITSEFARSKMNVSNVDITACDGRGSIRGIVAPGAKNVTWFNESGNIVGKQLDLVDLPDGKYKLVVDNGACSTETVDFTIASGSLTLNTSGAQITKANCNEADGEIKGITYNASGTTTATWTNQNGAVVGNSIDLLNVPTGSYTLNLRSTDNCAKIYGPLTVGNTTGPAIDQTAAIIQPTNCGQTMGSITGITATGTGTLKYTWKNSAQQIVATTADLTGKAAGQYRLEVTDDTQCGPVYTTVLTIPETNGITLNDANLVITPSSCNTDNGSVKGTTVSGATAYKWLNSDNITVGTTIDLLNAPAGAYTFIASNAYGCLQSRNYTIGQQALTQYPPYSSLVVASCIGMSNGTLNITVDNKVAAVRWVNSQNTYLGNNAAINNLPPGDYRLYLTDYNGCEVLYKTYTVPGISPIMITPNSAIITNDVCGKKEGSIKNIQVSGGAVNSHNYEWTDSKSTIIGATADLNNIGAGTYNLRIYDADNCNQANVTFTVTDETNQPTAPVTADIEICNSGEALIAVNNPEVGYQYKLYETAASTTPIATQAGGKFVINVNSSRDYYISRSFGSCESSRSKVHVSLTVATLNIPNTVTPNGDGINDLWLIPGLQSNTSTLVQLFNREGTKVFESKGYVQPFDGKSNGRQLPLGAYYYVINPGKGCKIFSGTLTIVP